MSDGARLLLRVGARWFEANPNDVLSVESWQPLIEIPWPTRYLGLVLCRGELVPVLDERQLGCTQGERNRIAIHAFGGGAVGVAAAEVRLGGGQEVFETLPLSAALEVISV